MSESNTEEVFEFGESRRDFLKKASAIGMGAVALEFFDRAKFPAKLMSKSLPAIRRSLIKVRATDFLSIRAESA